MGKRRQVEWLREHEMGKRRRGFREGRRGERGGGVGMRREVEGLRQGRREERWKG